MGINDENGLKIMTTFNNCWEERQQTGDAGMKTGYPTEPCQFTHDRAQYKYLFMAFVFAVALVLFSPMSAEALSIQSQVSHTKISLQDQFQFSVIVSDDKTQNLPQPDLPQEFEGFAILSGPNRSTSIQIVNFQMTSTATFSYILAPLKTGTFTLPAVSVTYQGKHFSSKETTVEVTDAPAGSVQQPGTAPDRGQGQQQEDNAGHSFFRLEVRKKKLYVGEQVLLEYVLYTREQIVDLGFTNLPPMTGFWVEEIEMKQIQQSRTEIKGVPYNRLLLKQQLLFPTSSGEIVIEPIALQLQIAVQRRSRSLFDDFFADPFSSRSQTKIVNSLPVELEVLALPAKDKPAAFNGLVGEYSAGMSLNKAEIKRNDSVTMTITISGNGNIQSIPEPVLPEIDNVKLYSPTVKRKVSKTASGISGSKTFEYLLVPRNEGELTIPEIEIPFFSPASQSYKTARTDAVVMNILASDEEQEDPLIVLAPAGNRNEVTLLGQDINHIKLDLSSLGDSSEYLVLKTWFWLLQLLPLCLIGLIAFIRWRQEVLRKDQAGTRYRKARNIANKFLKEASRELKNNEATTFYQVLGKALSTYLGHKLNVSETGMTNDQLEELLTERAVPENIINDALGVLQQCDFARFAPAEKANSEMKATLEKARTVINNLEHLKLKQ